MNKTKKLATVIIVVMLLVLTAVGLVACDTSLSDKLDQILNEMSELRKQMEKQQEEIVKLVGTDAVRVLFINPELKLLDYATAPKQSLEDKFTSKIVSYSDVTAHADKLVITQLDVLNYMESTGSIDFVFDPAVGITSIEIMGSSYKIESDGSNFIFNFTTVASICPPTPSSWDYSFEYKGFEAFSSYQSIPKSTVLPGSIMGFGFVTANW